MKKVLKEMSFGIIKEIDKIWKKVKDFFRFQKSNYMFTVRVLSFKLLRTLKMKPNTQKQANPTIFKNLEN